ncbi:hypothetical protein NQ317_009948 [Molorchus minor]|uniref:KASH domain-containing protein n=1 Tax=Molorchus minor TaxID=1323400 RepID=A0ABQ9K9L3_9CUCU|nr:hypothetical protein NQ317_009948 [Molorchus minor]
MDSDGFNPPKKGMVKVLHRDIENHGKIVGSVVKLCKRTDAKCNTINTRRIANGLERRWHLLFLRSLEWQCYLESLSKKQNLRNSATSSDESDSDCYREPATKYPRLSGRERSIIDEPTGLTYDIGMTENAGVEDVNGIDVLDGQFTNSSEDTSHFTKSDKKAPNLATYYFRHEDTDSDMDKVEQHCNNLKTDGQSTLEETSEEEWTYTKNGDSENTTTDCKEGGSRVEEVEESHIIPKPKAIPEDTIRRLVQKAEELVSPEKCRKGDRTNSLSKLKVNKWLSMDKPDDSCDASGEDDEKESQTSEDFETSTATLREANGSNSQNTSFDELNSTNGSRQWHGSSVTQLNEVPTTGINSFSISESALHKMNLTPKILDRFTTVSSNVVNSNHSTSSTVEEISPLLTEKTSPIRRKKSKLKKKTLFGKSDTHLLYSPVTPRNRNLLIKSGSFSGYSSRFPNNDRYSSSDPPTGQICVHGIFCETSTTSGADSDEDFNRRIPNFKLGFKTRYLHNAEMRDDSPGKNSLNTAEEQSSSLSEQAWDNYQENYLSEAYSESHDSDAARKLLNFGEDYRNFIDSQSDWSAFSDMSPTFKRKSLVAQNAEDSNSDEESLKQLISDSKDQLVYAEEIYKQVRLGLNNHLVTNEIDDLISTCDRHIALLNHMNESSDEYKMSSSDKAVTTGLVGQWRCLKIKSLKMQEYRRLQKQILELKTFVTSVNMPDKRKVFAQNFPVEDIHNEIDACNKFLEAITNQGLKLASLNAIVHRFTLENQDVQDFSQCSLKADITELYELFDNAPWKTLESRLEQLQKDLQEDEKTIHMLDSCLTNGTFTDQTASCVRDVAKVLSETTAHQGYHPLQEIFTEGSFSDSGISDEGSEHEIGERQGRLAAIRRLVRQLEVGLSPDSKARQLMREKLNAAEEELKALQQRCRSLIVRTAACSASTIPKRLSQEAKDEVPPATKPKDGDDDPGKDPNTQSWFKRMFKASLAFQLVIITFVCLSCLFEPQCCDYMNNYSWSVSPKLHYDGRPPI